MSAYSDKVIADGATAYWRLNEPSGLTFADAAGTRPATMAASTGLTYGVPGALADGTTGLGTDGSQGAASFTTLATGTTCSIEFWLRPLALGGAYSGIVGAAGGGPGIYYNGATRKINCQTGADVFNATTLTAGSLYHVVISLAGGSGTFYVNGVADGAIAGWPGQSCTALFKVGGGSLYATLIDEVAIYPTALTPAQISAHYALASVVPAPPPYAPIVLPSAKPPHNLWMPLTPSDVVDSPFSALWVGGAGTVAAVGLDGRVVNFTGVQAGTRLRVSGRRVNDTATTATALLALGRV